MYLLWLNRVTYPDASRSLWIPQLWLLIVASRMASLWLGGGNALSAQALEEGSPFDRALLTGLILAALLVVLQRRDRCATIIAQNPAITIFVVLSLASLAWSDYPAVGMKRWVKELGNVLMVLVVLSDREPVKAAQLILARTAYILIPLSVVVWKYFPELGRMYHRYSGELMITGVTTSKNNLGALCLIGFLFCFWRLQVRTVPVAGEAFARRRRADVAVALIAAWLLLMINSMTSSILACFGIVVLLAARLMNGARRRLFGRLAIVGVVALTAATPALLMTGVSEDEITKLEGKEATFWGRVSFWPQLVALTGQSALFGVGFDTFWLGSRLESLWSRYWWRPRSAHNGYVETYLDTGVLGTVVLVWFLLTAVSNARRGALQRDAEWAVLRIAFLLCGAAYNVTESAFKGLHPIWVVSLLVGLRVPLAKDNVTETATDSANLRESTPFRRLSLPAASAGIVGSSRRALAQHRPTALRRRY
jgi:O-antigen ligase